MTILPFRACTLALVVGLVAATPAPSYGYYNYKCTDAAGRVTYQDKPCGALARAAADKPSAQRTPEERDALLEENHRARFNRPPDSKVEKIFAACPAIPDNLLSQVYAVLFHAMSMQAACDAAVPGFRKRTAASRRQLAKEDLVRKVENDPAFKEYVRQIAKRARDTPPTGEAMSAMVRQCEQIAESLQKSAAVSSTPAPRPARDARYANANRTISAVQAALREGRIDDALRPMTSEARAALEERLRALPRDDLRALADAMAPYRFRAWIGGACQAAQATRDDTGDVRSVIELENQAGNWIIYAIRGPDFDRWLAK